MALIDNEYLKLIEKILKEGVYTQNRTGVPTYQIPYHIFELDLQKEFPILTTKKVAFKTAAIEFLWIYQQQTSDIRKLQELGVKIWDKWQVDEDGIYRKGPSGETDFGKEYAGTAGETYGSILNSRQSVQNVINKLKNNPTDRRIIIDLWKEEVFDKAVLPPCVFCHQFNVSGDTLNMVTNQRSCDVPVGVPFDLVQAGLLLSTLAHVTGYKPGKICYVMTNVHIYENQIPMVEEQKKYLCDAKDAPKLWLNPEVKDFFEFDFSKELKDIKLLDYKYCAEIKIPVSA